MIAGIPTVYQVLLCYTSSLLNIELQVIRVEIRKNKICITITDVLVLLLCD